MEGVLLAQLGLLTEGGVGRTKNPWLCGSNQNIAAGCVICKEALALLHN